MAGHILAFELSDSTEMWRKKEKVKQLQNKWNTEIH